MDTQHTDRIRASIESARLALLASHNLRVTDLSVEEIKDRLNEGVAREQLEWMTDHTGAIAALDDALQLLGSSN